MKGLDTQAQSIAQKMKDRENEILCLIEIGIIKSTEGDHSKAIFTFEKAQEII